MLAGLYGHEGIGGPPLPLLFCILSSTRPSLISLYQTLSTLIQVSSTSNCSSSF